MSAIEIIGAPQSVYVRAARMALEEKSVPYTLIAAAPHSAQVLALHPFGKIPAMRHGRFVLFESKAIATYVDRAFPGPKLLPDDAKLAAQTEQWVSEINTGVFPTVARYMQANAFPQGEDGRPDLATIRDLLPGVRRMVEILDRAVAPSGHLAGDGFGLADIFLMPLLAYLRMFPESAHILRATALETYFVRHAQRHSFVATIPPPLAASRPA